MWRAEYLDVLKDLKGANLFLAVQCGNARDSGHEMMQESLEYKEVFILGMI